MHSIFLNGAGRLWPDSLIPAGVDRGERAASRLDDRGPVQGEVLTEARADDLDGLRQAALRDEGDRGPGSRNIF